MASTLGLTALVDILMATIGVFIIVFALQKLDDTPVRFPAPYDVLVICRDPGTVAFHRRQQETLLIDPTELRALLERTTPDGGRFLVGITPGCAVPDGKGSTPSQQLINAFEAANKVVRDKADALHLYDLAPVGGDDFDEQALLAKWRAPREALAR